MSVRLFFALMLLFTLMLQHAPSPVDAQPAPPARPTPDISSSSLSFRHLTTEDGLPINRITALRQDAHGFLWIGTPEGLVRYDGYQLLVYRRDPARTNSLSSDSITALETDHAGNVWVGTSRGLDRFDQASQRFEHLVLPPQASSSPGVTSLTFHGLQDLWVGGEMATSSV